MREADKQQTMVQMIFSLRFQSQLRRTRPVLLKKLESAIVEAVESYGGKVRIEHRLVAAVFNEDTIGFWLDMLCVLEAIKGALERVSSELYGHICIVGQDIPEDDLPGLARALPSGLWGTGIWCAAALRPSLESYIDFDEALSGNGFLAAGYAQIRTIRELGVRAEETGPEQAGAEKMFQYLKQGNVKNTLIVGQSAGKEEGLYRFCREQMKNFPLLLIRFIPGKNTAACFADALSLELKEALRGCGGFSELEELSKALFSERLRDELSGFTVKRVERFFSLFLDACREGAEKKGVKALLILENVQDADSAARLIIMGVNAARPARERIRCFGTCVNLSGVSPWEELFPRIVKFTAEKNKKFLLPALPRDLWEIGYGCVLFRRFFPPFLVPQLFQEEGKNPAMVEKALSILSLLHLGSIQAEAAFAARAEETLGSGVKKIQVMVRNRLLVWVDNFRLKPCFGLLRALSELGLRSEDNLILDSIGADILNGTFQSMEAAVKDGSFALITGEDREAVLSGIIKTQKTLIQGGREEIEAAFAPGSHGSRSKAVPGRPGSPAFAVQHFAGLASFYLGNGDKRQAAEAVKEAMFLCQNENGGKGLARIYRLFSLVELENGRLADAIDYFTFAVENAEKAEDHAEMSVSAYYTAAAHFIFGNISRAMDLAVQARNAALKAVLPGWAGRSRFLEGRLYFESGNYQAAMDIFKDLKSGPLGTDAPEFGRTLSAWIYRAGAYLGGSLADHDGGPDAAIFELEAAFLSGDYQKVLDLSASGGRNPAEEPGFIFIEQPDWYSGFCQCEQLLFPLKELRNRMIHTFRALALSRLDSGKEADALDRDEAIREMQRIIRDELPETDPNGAFYLYSRYRILKQTGAPEVDMNTAVSIAFKRLQKRASRIDDNEIKRKFLYSHYWNSALVEAAKEHKLI